MLLPAVSPCPVKEATSPPAISLQDAPLLVKEGTKTLQTPGEGNEQFLQTAENLCYFRESRVKLKSIVIQFRLCKSLHFPHNCYYLLNTCMQLILNKTISINLYRYPVKCILLSPCIMILQVDNQGRKANSSKPTVGKQEEQNLIWNLLIPEPHVIA